MAQRFCTGLIFAGMLSLVGVGTGCGGLLHQSFTVRKAVEDKSYAVDRVAVKKENGVKTIFVYTENIVDKYGQEEIKDTVREAVPDVDKVYVTRATAKPNNGSGSSKPNSKPNSNSDSKPNSKPNSDSSPDSKPNSGPAT